MIYQTKHKLFMTFQVDTVLTHENNKKIKPNFIENVENKINTICKKKKKNRRMRIFEHRIFLSFLAGKSATIEQMLLTE